MHGRRVAWMIGTSLLATACAATAATAGPLPAQQDEPGTAQSQSVAAPSDGTSAKERDEQDKTRTTSAAKVDPTDIVITGTRIFRPNLISNAPLTVIDAGYLKDRGLARIEDALAEQPQVSPILGLQGTSWTSGKAPIGLRNLGPGRTLVLLNGQRMDNDVGIVPGALIERIDIMTGGASAVYGSDAIAGVVNFIVKRKFNGIALEAEASGYQHRNDNHMLLGLGDTYGYPRPGRAFFGGGNFFASAAAGKTLLDDRLNVSFFASAKRAEPIRYSDLDTTLCPLTMYDPRVRKTNDSWGCETTTNNPYGYFGVNGQNLSNDRGGSRNWRDYDETDERRGAQTGFLQRRDDTINGGGFLSADLPGSLRLNGSFLYSHTVEQGANAVDASFSASDVRINCDNPFLGAQQAATLCGAAAGSAALSQTIDVELWPKETTQDFRFTQTDWRGAIGLTGRIVDNIRFELQYQRTRNLSRAGSTNVFVGDSDDRLARGLQVRTVNGVPTCLSTIDGSDPACVPIDAFSARSPLNDATVHWLTGTGRQFQQNDLQVINAGLSGTLEKYGLKSPLASNGIGFSINGEYRRYRNQSQGFGAWSNFSTFDGRTSVREIGGEIDVPLIENRPFVRELSVNGGYRISDYDVYDHLVRSWKAEGSWAPVDGLRLRASYNRAVMVGVQQRLEGENRYPNSRIFDLCAPPRAGSKLTRYTFERCAVGGVTRAQYDALTSYAGCNTRGYCPTTLVNGGNAALEPERSRSTTIGLVLQPGFLPGFTSTVDWYNIDIRGAFEGARVGIAFNQCYDRNVQFFCSLYHRDPATGRVVEVDGRYQNSGYTATQGLDFGTSYAIDPRRFGIGGDIGRFNLNLNGTLVTKFAKQFAPGTQAWSCLGYFGFSCGGPMPRWRHVVGLHWRLPWLTAGVGLSWRHTAPTLLSKFSANPVLAGAPGQSYPLASRLPPADYLDLATSVTLVKGVDARFNVQNVFDKAPPLVGDDTGHGIGTLFNTYPGYYSVRGRVLRIGLSARL